MITLSNAHLAAAQRWSLALALAALPFELLRGLAIGGLTLSSVELALLAALLLWAGRLLAERRWPAAPSWLLLGAGALLAALLLSALLAVDERAGALKFALRQAQGALLAICVADSLARERAAAGMLAGGLLSGVSLSAALGLLEISELPAALALVAPFKADGSFMGGLLRLSGSFSYANTAAMYFEALLPLALLASLPRGAPGPPLARLARGLAPALILLAALLTYSRAALLVCGMLLLATPALAWRGLGPRAGRWAAGVGAGLAGLALLLALLSPTFRLRVTEPEVSSWYGARYRPSALGQLTPGELRRVPIELENSGRIAWEPAGLRPVRLAYHWLEAGSRRLVRYEGRRSELPRRVSPGERLQMLALVQAPVEPGRYILSWDLLREYIGRGWFSQMGIAPAELVVQVAGAPVAGAPPTGVDPPSSPRQVAFIPPPPGRRALWATALGLWAGRPLVGIGPDVFRHIYGPLLGLTFFDDRVHTNNLYIELLTGSGLLGLGAFLALAGAALWAGGRALWAGAPAAPLLIAALLGLLAFLAHGMLDVFLAFTPTYGLLWAFFGVVAGLADRGAAPRRAP